MVFHSIQFFVFFAAVVLGYYLLPGRVRWMGLLAASLIFYGISEPVFVIQILAVTGLCHWLALRIENLTDKQARKRLLAAGVVIVVANLVVFKYSGFINESLRTAFGWAGAPYSIPALDIWLPVGISFYTFQLISYLVDVYRGSAAERNVGILALYVTFFPKVIAGPIERAKNLLPQLHASHEFSYRRTVEGLQLILWGLFKKVVVADRIAPLVSQVYDNPQAHDGVTLTLATWMYAFQIYCDFSGYTDIALGAAAILGIKLTANFNRPYFATSISDFWKRWHISLSSWLTDYVYTPLTRQRVLKIKFYYLMLLGLLVTFIVSGLWHGAQWTFVLWGTLHGLYMVGSVLSQKLRSRFNNAVGLAKRPALHRAVKIAVTFNLVCFAYIFFRAESVQEAFHIIRHLGTGWSQAPHTIKVFIHEDFSEFVLAALGVAVVMGTELLHGKVDVGALAAKRPLIRWGLYYAGAVSIMLFGAFYGLQQQFIYFRF